MRLSPTLSQTTVCQLLSQASVLQSLLPLEDVGQHRARSGQLAHLAQELGLGILTHQAGGDGHGALEKKKRAKVNHQWKEIRK